MFSRTQFHRFIFKKSKGGSAHLEDTCDGVHVMLLAVKFKSDLVALDRLDNLLDQRHLAWNPVDPFDIQAA